MKQFSLLTAVVLYGSMAAAQQQKIGCYKSASGMKFDSTSDFNSIGYCGVDQCVGKAAFAMQGPRCYCGDEIPPDSDKVDLDKCDFMCKGWPEDNCGGSVVNSFYMIYDQGTVGEIPKAKASSSSTSSTSAPTSSATTSSRTTATSAAEQTDRPTASSEATPSETSSSSGSKPNTAGIAAGVVVGIVAILAIAGGLFFFLRNRKRKAIEEEHRRNAAVNSFVAGGKPPNSSDGSSAFTDTRLDPVMAQRRMSDGSIADNQDYSRRILKVTNA